MINAADTTTLYKFISYAYPSSPASEHYQVQQQGGYYVNTVRADIQADGIQYNVPEYASSFCYRRLRDAVDVLDSTEGEHIPQWCHTRDLTPAQIAEIHVTYAGNVVG